MDPAFLRRMPYKIEVGTPTAEVYRRIFEKECQAQGLTLTDEVFEFVVRKVKGEKQLELAAFQPRFILEQVVASCRFSEQAPTLEPRFLNYAIDNLRVRHAVPATDGAAAAAN
jgi:chromosomal replication initiation ATPase DnaA